MEPPSDGSKWGLSDGTVVNVSFWRIPFAYHMAVMACFNLTHFLTIRTSLWLELGNSEAFWKILAAYTQDVIKCMKRVSVLPPDRAARQEMIKEDLISFNHPNERDKLRQACPGTHCFLGRLWKLQQQQQQRQQQQQQQSESDSASTSMSSANAAARAAAVEIRAAATATATVADAVADTVNPADLVLGQQQQQQQQQ
jgi:SpoVK/Ycf46/Vps4 family AAA+-type ATPase